MEWLLGLAGPVHAVYEAGPTGYRLARAGAERGVRIDVIAPGKTPRAAADRIKTDRRDAELLVRQLMAGSLSAIHVPSPALEAARDLVRAREDVRCDLPRARHRVSKLLLRHGQVYPRASRRGRSDTATGWRRVALTSQTRAGVYRQPGGRGRSDQSSRRAGRATQPRRLRRRAVADRRPAARVSRHRHADRSGLSLRGRRLAPLRPPRPARCLGRPGAVAESVRRVASQRCDHQDRQPTRPPAAGRGSLALPAATPHRRDTPKPPAGPARPHPRRSPGAPSTDSTASTSDCESAANTPTSSPSRPRASWPASAGQQPPHPNPRRHPTRW